MGVNGLWSLLDPAARPIALETLSNKRLAIDASIWLYQFQMAMRDKKTGETLHGAHITGFFQRIVKLLYHGIKPVFVFDGPAPMLKKRTIAERKQRKAGAARDHAKVAKELLSAQLRALATGEILENRKNKGKGKAKDQDEEYYDTGDYIDPDKVVYYDDTNDGTTRHSKSSPSKSTTTANGGLVLPPPPSLKPKRFIPKDQYALPTLEESLEARAGVHDPRVATEEEQRDFLEDFLPEDLDSELFLSLPIQEKYDIIGEMRLKSRQVNHKRVKDAANSTPLDFSKTQIINLMQRNNLTQKLFSVTDELGAGQVNKNAIVIPSRVAGERNREYVLVKQDQMKGGGWVLGIQDPARLNNEPIVIDDSSDDGDSFDDEAGYHTEEEPQQQARTLASLNSISSTSNSDLNSVSRATRRQLAIEALIARNIIPSSSTSTLDPFLDIVVGEKNQKQGLFDEEEDEDEEMDGEFQAALAASLKDQGSNEVVVDSDDEGDWEDAIPIVTSTTTTGNKTVQKKLVLVVESDEDELEYADDPLASLPSVVKTVSRVEEEEEEVEDSDDEDGFEDVLAPPPPAPPTKSSIPLDPLLASTRNRSPSFPPPPPVQAPVVIRKRRGILETLLLSDDDNDDEEPDFKPRHSPTPPVFEITSNIPTRSISTSNVAVSKSLPSSSTQFVVRDRTNSNRPDYSPEPFSGDEQEQEEEEERVIVRDSGNVDKEIEIGKEEEVVVKEEDLDDELISFSPRSPSRTNEEEERVVIERDVEEREETEKAIALSLIEAERFDKRQEIEMEVDENDLEENSVASSQSPVVEDDVEEEEEEAFEWEKSPTPPPRASTSSRPPLFTVASDDFEEELEEPDFVRIEREENEKKMEREQEQYESMMSELTNKSLEDRREENRLEIEKLQAQRNQAMRNQEGVTKNQVSDVKELLSFFGIPYVDAPEEAEAECAQLLTLNLVDGIVTDDSDVFLFGGKRVFRNMFNQGKTVQCYLLDDLDKHLGLDRDKLVRLSYLLGGDYADGLMGVGPVLGRELVEEFKGEDGLKDFKDWWMKVQTGKDTEEDNSTAWKRKFKKGHKNLFLDDSWPNPVIAQAYYKPSVNHDEEAFSWAPMDLDGLRTYLYNTINRGTEKTDAELVPIIARQNLRKDGKLKIQANLSQYFDMSAGLGALAPRSQRVGYQSTRLQNVVSSFRKSQKRVKNSSSSSSSSSEEEMRPPPVPKRKKSSTPAKVLEAGNLNQSESGLKHPSPTPPAAASSSSFITKSKKSKPNGPIRKRAPVKISMAARKKAEKARRDERALANGGVYSDDDRDEVIAVEKKKTAARPRKKAIVESEESEEEVEEANKRKKKGKGKGVNRSEDSQDSD